MIALMGARENQLIGNRNMLTQLMQGMELPSVIEGREADTAYLKAMTKEMGDKVTVITPQGPLLVSPDKAMEWAYRAEDRALDERKITADEAYSKAVTLFNNAKTENEKLDYKTKLGRMSKEMELLDTQLAVEKAKNNEYMTINSPDPNDVDENGNIRKIQIRGKDFMDLQIAKAQEYITEQQKANAIKNKNAEDLSKMVDKLRLIETGFMGTDSKGNKNKSNPSRIPDSQFFNQYSSTPYMWLWDSDEEEMKKIQLPQLQDGSQITAREVFQANTQSDVLQWLIQNFPEFMKQQGVIDASQYRESLQ